MKTSAILLSLITACAVAGAQEQEKTFPSPAVGASAATLRQLFQSYWEWRLAQSPELATQVGRTEYNDRWRDWSRTSRDAARLAREAFLERVIDIGLGNLTPSERLSAHLIEYELRTQLEAERYLHVVQRISQAGGAHTEVFTVIDQMPARTERDYRNILARIRALPRYVEQHIALMQEQIAAGLTQPAVVVDLTLEQIGAQRRASAGDTPLLAAFRRMPADIPEARQQALGAEARAAYEQQFVPAWTRLEAFFRDTYRPRARPQIGVTTVPDGRAAYAALIHSYTTTRMEPESIHKLGLSEVARIEAEMQRIAAAAGFAGSVSDYERQLRTQPGMRFTSEDEMIAYARDVMARLQPRLPLLFRRVPRMPVDVRPIPADRAASTPSNYTAGTTDGTRSAWFNMNTYRPQEQVKYRVPALVLHEAMPGHHLQIGIARELGNIPEFRRVFGAAAFSEGWALYAESLGDDRVYSDPSTRFGQLASERFRAVRLVVDTGIHALGWSRARALEYFTLHVPSESTAEIDRYISWPGQALAYKLGELKIKALRRQAQSALGATFDLRDFHDAVLRNGSLPLDMLEEQVNLYIAAATASRK